MVTNKMLEALKEHLSKISEEEKQNLLCKNIIPKGWVKVKDYLPMFLAKDIFQGYSEYLVRDKDGNEFETRVCDHNTWKYYAEQEGITHWFNK